MIPPLSKPPLGTFKLMMIAIISVDSIRNLPIAAQYGTSLVTFYLLAGLLFFVPLMMVTHFLAKRYPQTGGSYLWIQAAFGPRWGLVSIWLQWIYNVIWYPTIFVFISTTVAAILGSTFENSTLFILIASLFFFWSMTLASCRGMQALSYFSALSTFFGTLIPMAIIMILAVYWLISGHSSHTPLSWSALIPSAANVSDIGFFNNILFSMLGLEVIAMHAGDVANPARSYARALFSSGILIVASLILSALALCIVLPPQQIGLISGVVEAFREFFAAYHMPWATNLMAAAIILGSLGTAISWISGLARGLHVAAMPSRLPTFFQTLNRHGMPQGILILQGIVFTILCSLFLLLPNLKSSYWLLSSMTAQFALLYYVLLFVAAFKLIKKEGGSVLQGLWILLAILTSVTGIVLGFMPPASLIDRASILHYEILMCVGACVFMLPLVFFMRRRNV